MPRMAFMSAAVPLRVALELDLDAETIGGRLEGPNGPLEFSGWLGLASALEQLLGSATSEVSTQPQRQQGETP